MPALSGNFPAAILEVLNEAFMNRWEELEPTYTQIFNEETTNRKTEKDIGFVGFGTIASVAEGETYGPQQPLEGSAKVYTQTKYGVVVPLTKELLLWHQYPQAFNIQTALARAARYTIDKIGADIFNNSFTTERTRYNLSIFNTAQTFDGKSGTWTNRPNPDVDLSYSTLWDRIVSMRQHMDDRGLIVNIIPKFLVVPPTSERVALEVTRSSYTPHTADNEENMARERYGIQPIVWNLITRGNDVFFVTSDKKDHMLKMIWAIRPPGETDAWEDKDLDVLKQKLTFMLAAGATDPRGLEGSAGA